MEACGSRFLKYLLFFFNLLFFISAIGIISVGALGLGAFKNFVKFSTTGLTSFSIVLIIAGVLILAITFLACCGAITEDRRMLIAFAIAMAVLIVIEVSVCIAAFVEKNNIRNGLQDVMKKTMVEYNSNADTKNSWDFVQRQFKCCGIEGPRDWNNIPPESCREDNQNYTEGCLSKLEVDLQRHVNWIGGLGIVVILVEIVGIIIASLLASAIKGESGNCA